MKITIGVETCCVKGCRRQNGDVLEHSIRRIGLGRSEANKSGFRSLVGTQSVDDTIGKRIHWADTASIQVVICKIAHCPRYCEQALVFPLFARKIESENAVTCCSTFKSRVARRCHSRPIIAPHILNWKLERLIRAIPLLECCNSKRSQRNQYY